MFMATRLNSVRNDLYDAITIKNIPGYIYIYNIMPK